MVTQSVNGVLASFRSSNTPPSEKIVSSAASGRAGKKLSGADAMAFASLAVDLNIAESVDFTNLVMARVPKRFFKNDRLDFWHRPLLVRNEAQRQGLEPIPPGRFVPED